MNRSLGWGVVATMTAAHLAEADLSATRTLEELRRIAFFDIGELFDDDGRLKRVKRLSAEARAVLASVKVRRTNLVSGDRQRERLHEVKLWDKLKALEILARHFRLEEGTTTVIVTTASGIIKASTMNSSTACRLRGMPAGFAVVSVWADCSTIIAARRNGSRVDAAALGRTVGHYESGKRRGS